MDYRADRSLLQHADIASIGLRPVYMASRFIGTPYGAIYPAPATLTESSLAQVCVEEGGAALRLDKASGKEP